jgi:biopolymer transport protein ExbD
MSDQGGDDFEPVVLKRRKVEEADMDITPMIDMTFLLLIFFIVSGHMSENSGVTLPSARYGGVVQLNQAVILTMAPGDPGVPSVFKGDGTAPETRLRGSTPEELDAAIEEYVDSERAKDDKKYVLVQAERGLKSREVNRVVRAAANRENIEQVYVGVMDKSK